MSQGRFLLLAIVLNSEGCCRKSERPTLVLRFRKPTDHLRALATSELTAAFLQIIQVQLRRFAFAALAGIYLHLTCPSHRLRSAVRDKAAECVGTRLATAITVQRQRITWLGGSGDQRLLAGIQDLGRVCQSHMAGEEGVRTCRVHTVEDRWQRV